MANLILVLEAHVTAHSTAPGARLWDGLNDQVSTTSTGGRGPIFTPHRRSPTGEIQDYGTSAPTCFSTSVQAETVPYSRTGARAL